MHVGSARNHTPTACSRSGSTAVHDRRTARQVLHGTCTASHACPRHGTTRTCPATCHQPARTLVSYGYSYRPVAYLALALLAMGCAPVRLTRAGSSTLHLTRQFRAACPLQASLQGHAPSFTSRCKSVKTRASQLRLTAATARVKLCLYHTLKNPGLRRVRKLVWC